VTVLTGLLDDGARFDCEYRGGLSNHLPMALVALQALGADDGQLRTFASDYERRLEPAPNRATWPTGDDWTGRFGQREAYAPYLDLFSQWLAHEGAADLLAQVLPRLMSGVGAAAFHGLIRTAHALRATHAGELTAGLAYWACRHLPLGALPSAPGRQSDPEPLLRRLRAGQSNAGLIFERMRDAAANDAELPAVVARLQVDEQTLPRLARLAARAYAHSGNFTALHLVTSAHALRLLLPFVDEPLVAVRWYWQAYACAVVAAGMTAQPQPALQPWAQILPKALASDDEHVVKLVDSCREEEQAYGGDDWRRAACRAALDGS
jgi:hypothetical protein